VREWLVPDRVETDLELIDNWGELVSDVIGQMIAVGIEADVQSPRLRVLGYSNNPIQLQEWLAPRQRDRTDAFADGFVDHPIDLIQMREIFVILVGVTEFTCEIASFVDL
jgi:hypothetical protein